MEGKESGMTVKSAKWPVLPGRVPSGTMKSMITVAIALREEDQRFVEEAIKSGRYSSESKVVAEALSELKVREAIRSSKIEDLREKVLVGIGQADRGEFAEFTAEQVKADGRARAAAKQGLQ